MVRSVQFFLFHPQLWLKWSVPPKNEHNWTKIDDLVSKTMFGDRKSSDTFLEKGKNLSKMVRSVHYFLFHPQLWLKWSVPPKNEHNWTKIDDLVSKTMFGDRKS